MNKTRIFWILASKGGAGKTLLSMYLHRSFFYTKSFSAKDTLILDLNTQNRDLYNILRKTSRTTSELMPVDTPFGKIMLSIFKLREPNLYVGTPREIISLPQYFTIPLQILRSIEFSSIIVDTNLNLSSVSNLSSSIIKKIKTFLADQDAYDEIDPLIFFIWTTGSITRQTFQSKNKAFYEMESIFTGIENIATIFNMQADIFSMKNLIVAINTTLWIYNTITILKTILADIQRLYVDEMRRGERLALFSFSRLTKDIILRASKISAEIISAVSGTSPKFRFIEPFFMMTLHHILFDASDVLLKKIATKVSLPEEFKILLEKVKEEQQLDLLPSNLFIVPPAVDIYNTLALIFSTHLLSPEDIDNILKDPDADNLPYRLISQQARYLAFFLDTYIKIRNKAGTKYEPHSLHGV